MNRHTRLLADVERRHVLEVLESTRNRIYGAGGVAEVLGLKPTTLYSLMARLSIERRREMTRYRRRVEGPSPPAPARKYAPQVRFAISPLSRKHMWMGPSPAHPVALPLHPDTHPTGSVGRLPLVVGVTSMVVFRVQFSLRPASRQQVVRSLRRVLGETRALPGCVSCQLCADVEDDSRLVLLEEWSDAHSLRNRLRLDGLKVVLSALDYAATRPEIRFDTIAETQGMELIAACRQDVTPDAARIGADDVE